MSQKPQSQKPEVKPTSPAPAPQPVVEQPKAPEAIVPAANAPAANLPPPFIGVPEKPAKVDRWPDRTRKSTIASPVAFVWELADQMTAKDPSARRKDVIAKAIEAGVAGYTARTQYQEWLKAKRESQANAAKIAEAAAKAATGQK